MLGDGVGVGAGPVTGRVDDGAAMVVVAARDDGPDGGTTWDGAAQGKVDTGFVGVGFVGTLRVGG